MSSDGRDILRSAGLILLQRGAIVVGSLLFVAIVPPLMGPGRYGQYLLLTSLATWLALLAGLGFTNTIGRHVPSLAARESPEDMRALLGNLLSLRLVSGGAAMIIFLALTLFWLRDLPFAALALVAASIWVQTIGNFFFAVFLGVSRAARWAAGDTARRWLLLAAVPLGYWLRGLPGACGALLAVEAVVLLLGAAWTRTGLSVRHLVPRRDVLEPHLRVGLTFLGAQILFAAFHGSGEPMVRAFTGDYREVSYFGLAHGAYLMAVGALGQVTLAFAPILSRQRDRGAAAELQDWTTRMLKAVGVSTVTAALVATALAEPLVAWLLGDAFHPIAMNLIVLAMAGIPLGLGSILGTLTVVHDRAGVSFVGSALRLVVLWGLGTTLLGPLGSLGACVAVLGGTLVHALWLAGGLRDRAAAGLRAWGIAVALGVPFLSLLSLGAQSIERWMLAAGAILGYTVTVVTTGLVTRADLRGLAPLRRGPP